MKPIRNLDLSVGLVAEGIRMGGRDRVGGCVGEVAVMGDVGPLLERKGCPCEEGIRGTAAAEK